MSDHVTRLFHQSGLFKRPAAWLADDVARQTATADVWTGTEFSGRDWEARAAALLVPGFTTLHDVTSPGTRECAILARTETREVVAFWVAELVAPSKTARGRIKAGVYAPIAILREPTTGVVELVSTCHTLAHSEGSLRRLLRGLGKVDIRGPKYRRMMLAWVAAVKAAQDEHKPDVTNVTADWNLNTRLPWVRSWLRETWAPCGLNVLAFPDRSFKKRSIDGAMTDADIEEGPRAFTAPSSDHLGVAMTLTQTIEGTGEPMPEMTGYKLADKKTQDFRGNYTGSPIDPNVGVIHSTETMGWPSYKGPSGTDFPGASAPTYTLYPNIAKKRIEFRQHFPEDRSARALRNEAGGVETNTLNCVQYEVIGTCDAAHAKTWAGKRAGVDYLYMPDVPDWFIDQFADFILDQHERLGIPLNIPDVWLAYGPDDRAPGRRPASYGDSPVRFSGQRWSRFKGFCGHQHVPENSHGDPGRFPMDKVIERVKKKMAPPAGPSRVTLARQDVAGAIAMLRETPEPRKGARALADALAAVLADEKYPSK